jgi:hypothetical protein
VIHEGEMLKELVVVQVRDLLHRQIQGMDAVP